MVFPCFQGVQKRNIGKKWVKMARRFRKKQGLQRILKKRQSARFPVSDLKKQDFLLFVQNKRPHLFHRIINFSNELFGCPISFNFFYNTKIEFLCNYKLCMQILFTWCSFRERQNVKHVLPQEVLEIFSCMEIVVPIKCQIFFFLLFFKFFFF